MSFRDGEIKNKRPPSILEQQVKKEITKELDGITTEATESDNKEYEAFKKGWDSKAVNMLEINIKEDTTLQIYYFNIKKIEFKGNSLLFITTPDDIITIEGRNFSEAKNHMRENRIVSINEFDPLKYVKLPVPNSPFIETISVEEVEKERVF